MFTTTTAVILLLIGASLDYSSCRPHVSFPEFALNNYFVALGTFLFAYGGHAAFPTIQHDMKRPSEFTKSTILAFGIITIMYVPVCIMGYITYGDSLRDSIINSIQNSALQQAINIFITIHCILTLTIVFNPLNQEAEEILNVPLEFGYKRVLVRTTTMAAVVFIAESVPKFGPVLELVGGSTLTLTSLIFPTLFYIKLSALLHRNEKEQQKIDGEVTTKIEDMPFSEVIKWTPKVLLIFFGIISGGAATYSALVRVFATDFVPPCYVAPFLKHFNLEQDEATNCCGTYQNITTLNDIKCAKSDFNFYN
uniref:Amino acid transporter transmembrane domain-containing protein n=1 Tax=Panagrolaimus sp. ES5 TaxID=591445 RepID=A0AC34FE69_9BILA